MQLQKPNHPRSTRTLKAAAALAAIGLAFTHPPGAAQQYDWAGGGWITPYEDQTVTDDIDLRNALILNVDQNLTVDFAGALTAPLGMMNALSLIGPGRVVLSGDNSGFNSNIVLQRGTLHLTGTQPTGPYARHIDVLQGATLSYGDGARIENTLFLQGSPFGPPVHWHVQSGVADHLGGISGDVPLIKTGAGTLRLLEPPGTSVTGRIDITEGGIWLEGGHYAGQIRVLDNAWLAGHGIAGRLQVESGATVHPSSLLTAANGIDFQPDSTLVITAYANGASSRLATWGAANLAGHVSVMPQGSANDWTDPVEYTIVDASLGLNGTEFDSVSSALPYLKPSLQYDAQRVLLRLTPHAVAPDDQIVASSTNQAGSVRSTLMDDSRFLREAVFQTASRTQTGPWSHAWHASGERRATSSGEGRSGQPPGQGTNADERHTSGIMLGGNTAVSANWHAGAYLGAATTRWSESRPAVTQQPGPASRPDARTRATSTHAGIFLHGQYRLGVLTAGAAHSWHSVKHHRTAHANGFSHGADGHQRARTMQLFARGAVNLWESSDQRSRVQPFLETAWVHHRDTAYAESGGPLAMRVTGRGQSVLYSTLGLGGEYRLPLPKGEAAFSASLGWRHAAGDIKTPVSQHYRDDSLRTPIVTAGQPLRRNAWDLQLGVQAEITKTARLGLRYSGLFSRGVQDHGVQLAMAVAW